MISMKLVRLLTWQCPKVGCGADKQQIEKIHQNIYICHIIWQIIYYIRLHNLCHGMVSCNACITFCLKIFAKELPDKKTTQSIWIPFLLFGSFNKFNNASWLDNNLNKLISKQ